MKVAILVPNFSKFSGDARVAEQQAREFAQKGDDVAVFALKGDIQLTYAKLYRMGMPRYAWFERIYRLLFPLDMLKIVRWLPKLKDYGLVISHLYPMNWLAFLAKRFYKVRYIFYNHGTNPPELFPKFYERIYLRIFLILTKLTAKNADSVISVSEYARKELKEQIGLESRVIYNKVNTDAFRRGIDGSKVREKHDIGDAPLLLFVGRIAPQKRVDLLIKSFRLIKRRIPNAKLIIVGEHVYDYYSKIIREMCDSSVILVNSLTHEELAYYYAACDVYATCSLWESFNLPLAEAHACGKPVVAFDIGPHREVIENGRLIEKGDLRGFAEACIEEISRSREIEIAPYTPPRRKICLVCSHGGHLTEILQLADAFDGHETFFITYRTVRTEELEKKYLLRNIGRNPINLLAILPGIFNILRSEKPDIVISTGAEIAIPALYVAKLLGIKTIYIESWCRVKEPSRTGKTVYPVSDVFLVQWKQLLDKYGRKAKYAGEVF